MIHHITTVIKILVVLATFAGLAYYVLCIWSAAKFLTRLKTAGPNIGPTQSLSPVSILKPLKGTDPEMYESFRSHCLQDYPEYEIIFGVSDPNDPAIELVERLKKEFPQRAIRLVICHASLGTNIKISNLAQMAREARHEHLLVNDSDIRVAPDYLRCVIAPLSDPTNGLVTCLYRGVAAPTLGSRLESLGISTDFIAGVLVARYLEGGIHFGLGSTLAFRRRDLEAIGGFESLVDYLADDYEIGKRIADRGLKIVLSDAVVDTFLPHYSFSGFFRHQLRWGRSIRDSRRWGYLGMVFTFGGPWALLALILAHGAIWAWGLLAAAAVLRTVMAWTVGRRILSDSQVLRLIWLVPLRDLMALIVWIASFAGHSITWRGSVFVLKDGKLAKINT